MFENNPLLKYQKARRLKLAQNCNSEFAFLLFTFCFLLFTSYAFAQPTTPILTLNTDMHTSRINSIDADATGKMILTLSPDKTAKLWDSQNGSLIRTFRIPIGEGNYGMIYSGAITPCGKTVALTGWTSKDGLSNDIYFFSTSTGMMLHRIGGLVNVIQDLEFSPDGKSLVACFSGNNGIRIYSNPYGFENPVGLTLIKSHTNYGATCHSAVWDKSGRLATVCYDGKLRLYDSNYNLIKEESNLAGKQPFSVAFSPDGSLLVVGYSDNKRIQVFDGKSLSITFEPDVTETNAVDNHFNQVCFSPCGNFLIAGGHFKKYIKDKWWYYVRVYKDKGQGAYSDFPAGQSAIRDIKSVSHFEGHFIFASGFPDFACMTITGKKIIYNIGEINNYRSKDKTHFKINTNGTAIGVMPMSALPIGFDIVTRTLSVAGFQNLSGFKASTSNHGGILITDWGGSLNPKINNINTNFLKANEKCLSVDIALDGKKIVFGADWRIYCTDNTGKKLWETTVQSMAVAVNISSDGRTLAAILADGIIHWYSLENGKLLLSLYLHPDNNRWVLWTPKGYFDASPGADALIGWHVNQGKDKEALYFPASRFRSTYYRPDIIDKVLITLDEDQAISFANQESSRKVSQTLLENSLPPVVRIFSPTNFHEVSSTNVTIEYNTTSPGGDEILNVRFLVDGRPVETQRGFKPVGQRNSESKTIIIPQKDVVVQVLAENKFGWSVPSEVNIKWKGVAPQPQDLLKPTLYILAIGVSEYQNPAYKLNFAAKDANDFTSTMLAQKGGLYKDVVARTLTDAKATKDNILDGLEWIQRETTSRDMAMVFLAGHGINDNSGVFYYMPHEANLESMRRTCLMFNELKHTASTIAGKVVMFVDACHSGNVMGGRRAPDINALVNELSDVESGAVVFTSSTGRQYSLEDASWGNGAFTKALIEGLQGKADLFGKGTITVKTLDAYVANRVKELTKGQQAPTAIIPQSMPDFSIGVKK